jgi:hypothetical protein
MMAGAGDSKFGTLSGVLLVVALCALPSTVGAQTVLTGQVLEDRSEEVIPGAEIRLIDGVGRIRARTVSGEDGSFQVRINLQRVDRFRFEAQRMGYEAVTTPRFVVHPYEAVHTEIRLLVDAVLLTPLTVVTRRSLTAPGIESFRFRAERGMGGHFITRADIEEQRAFHLSDLLAAAPGVRLGPSMGAGGRMVYINRAAPREGGCPPQLFIDGRHVNARTLQPTQGRGQGVTGYRTDLGLRIDEYVTLQSVEGIEVYRGLATIPPEFYTPDARCGVIAIWTRTQ